MSSYFFFYFFFTIIALGDLHDFQNSILGDIWGIFSSSYIFSYIQFQFRWMFSPKFKIQPASLFVCYLGRILWIFVLKFCVLLNFEVTFFVFIFLPSFCVPLALIVLCFWSYSTRGISGFSFWSCARWGRSFVETWNMMHATLKSSGFLKDMEGWKGLIWSLVSIALILILLVCVFKHRTCFQAVVFPTIMTTNNSSAIICPFAPFSQLGYLHFFCCIICPLEENKGKVNLDFSYLITFILGCIKYYCSFVLKKPLLLSFLLCWKNFLFGFRKWFLRLLKDLVCALAPLCTLSLQA